MRSITLELIPASSSCRPSKLEQIFKSSNASQPIFWQYRQTKACLHLAQKVIPKYLECNPGFLVALRSARMPQPLVAAFKNS